MILSVHQLYLLKTHNHNVRLNTFRCKMIFNKHRFCAIVHRKPKVMGQPDASDPERDLAVIAKLNCGL